MNAPLFFDFHTHSTLKPYMLSAVDSPWEDYDQALPHERVRRTPRLTQSDFTKLLRSGTRVIMLALHPIERYLIAALTTRPVMYALVFRMRLERVRQVLQRNPFTILQQEYNLLLAYLRQPDGPGEVVIVRRAADIDKALSSPHRIAVLLSIEGAHGLGFEFRDYRFPKIKGFSYEGFVPLEREVIRQRLDWAAERGVHMITLVHMVYNHLGTPAKAVEQRGALKLIPNPIRSLRGLGRFRGLTPYGVHFVEEAFRRYILIDVKHCDYLTRTQIYEIARDFNMPVVASHVAASGHSFQRRVRHIDRPRHRLNSDTFNPWDINLHDEDIIAIARSRGLIGLIMDERVLAGEKLLQAARIGEVHPLEPLFQQIRYIYLTLLRADFSPEEAFRVLCIGSDFDGFIDPIDPVPTVLEYPLILLPELERFFEREYEVFAATGYSPQELAQRFCFLNGVNFWKEFLTRKEQAFALQPSQAPSL
ncbi:MAG: membrane dipeptidase [Bacteroidia bacterium]|nr:membrane dipeptidase [Bacteroidia bacterium]MDW8015020.1 membrane dipeptidase [Bacteroidia bacterium]